MHLLISLPLVRVYISSGVQQYISSSTGATQWYTSYTRKSTHELVHWQYCCQIYWRCCRLFWQHFQSILTESTVKLSSIPVVYLSSILAERVFKYTGRKCCRVYWQKVLSSKLTIYWQSSTGILAIYWRYSQSEVLRWCCPFSPFAQYRARVFASTVLTGLPTPVTVRVALHTRRGI